MTKLSRQEMTEILGGLTCSYGEITQCLSCFIELPLAGTHGCLVCPELLDCY